MTKRPRQNLSRSLFMTTLVTSAMALATALSTFADVTIDPDSTDATDITDTLGNKVDPTTTTINDDLVIGFGLVGVLLIDDTTDGNGLTTVSSKIGLLGQNTDSVGIGTVTGATSTWTNSSSLIVGNQGNGTLSITNGGTVSNIAAVIGNLADSSGETTTFGTGTVTVSNTGSSWISDALTVGKFGIGSVLINDGAMVSNSLAIIGDFIESNGNMTVSDAGSSWTNSDAMIIGKSGTGTLRISDGATVSNTTAVIGDAIESSGDVTVSDANSKWTHDGSLKVGNNGNGMLLIDNGGAINNTSGVIGIATDSIGMVSVNGTDSSWTNEESLSVGDQGSGTLSITNGGAVSNTNGRIADKTGSTGFVTVSGANSSWTNEEDLSVGDQGSGTLSITNGGTVSNTSGRIADQFGSTGDVTVSGNDSSWTQSEDLFIGSFGSGTLSINDGGKVISNTMAIVGNATGSSGDVTVSGTGSSWTHNNDLFVANAGTGTLFITNGGTVSSTNSKIAEGPGSIGIVEVSGTGSTWTHSNSLFVGFVNGSDQASGGGGQLTVNFGATVSITNTLKIWQKGTVILNGGVIRTANLEVVPGGAFFFVFGTLDVVGDLAYDNTFVIPSETLTAGLTLQVAGQLTLLAPLKLAGGELAVSSINNAPLLDFVTGTLRLNSDLLTIGDNGIVGNTVDLTAGKHIAADNEATPLDHLGARTPLAPDPRTSDVEWQRSIGRQPLLRRTVQPTQCGDSPGRRLDTAGQRFLWQPVLSSSDGWTVDFSDPVRADRP